MFVKKTDEEMREFYKTASPHEVALYFKLLRNEENKEQSKERQDEILDQINLLLDELNEYPGNRFFCMSSVPKEKTTVEELQEENRELKRSYKEAMNKLHAFKELCVYYFEKDIELDELFEFNIKNK